jgi:hypothetical protein
MNIRHTGRDGGDVPLPPFAVHPNWDKDQLQAGREHTVERLELLEREADDIVSQLERAASREAGEGIPINMIWWGKASCALKYRRKEIKNLRRCLEEIEGRLTYHQATPERGSTAL